MDKLIEDADQAIAAANEAVDHIGQVVADLQGQVEELPVPNVPAPLAETTVGSDTAEAFNLQETLAALRQAQVDAETQLSDTRAAAAAAGQHADAAQAAAAEVEALQGAPELDVY